MIHPLVSGHNLKDMLEHFLVAFKYLAFVIADIEAIIFHIFHFTSYLPTLKLFNEPFVMLILSSEALAI